jgi:hypothetical protein
MLWLLILAINYNHKSKKHIFMMMELLDFRYLCQQVLQSNDRVVAVWIRREENNVQHATRKGFPLPNDFEMEKMLLQGWVMLSLACTNESMYGRVGSIIVNHEELSAFLIPIDRKYFMGVGCAKPCNPCAVLNNIEVIIAEAKNCKPGELKRS